jgi:elongation factor Ts
MAKIAAADVMKLRAATGAGPVDCKKALEAADGDFAAAEKALKEKGLAAVEKRADRAANEGRIFIQAKGKYANEGGASAGDAIVLVEVDSETDFVAKNPDFIKMGNDIAAKAIAENITAPNDALAGMVTDLATRIREKMTLKRVILQKPAAGEYIASYIHGDGQNLGVTVTVCADDAAAFEKPEVRAFAHDLCLHTAAFNPRAVSRDKLDAKWVADQKEIFEGQMKNDPKMASKPEQAKAKILEGKLNKLLGEVCFLDQAYVKDDKISVKQALEDCGKQAGCKLEIKSFCYVKVGVEG